MKKFYFINNKHLILSKSCFLLLFKSKMKEFFNGQRKTNTRIEEQIFFTVFWFQVNSPLISLFAVIEWVNISSSSSSFCDLLLFVCSGIYSSSWNNSKESYSFWIKVKCFPFFSYFILFYFVTHEYNGKSKVDLLYQSLFLLLKYINVNNHLSLLIVYYIEDITRI